MNRAILRAQGTPAARRNLRLAPENRIEMLDETSTRPARADPDWRAAVARLPPADA